MEDDFYADHTDPKFDKSYSDDKIVLRKMLRLIHTNMDCFDHNSYKPNDELRSLIIDVYNAYGIKKYNESDVCNTIFRAFSYINTFVIHFSSIGYIDINIDGVNINFSVYQK